MSLSDFGNLRELYLNESILTGSISANFLVNTNTTEKIVTVGINNNNIMGEFPVELDRFKKLQIDIQGSKLSNLAEDLCNMKKWDGRLMGNFGCDANLCPRNNFSAKCRWENYEEEWQTYPDGNSSNHLGSDRCKPNAATDDSEAASAPTVITYTPIQSNPNKKSQYKLTQAQSGGVLWDATKAFIIMMGLAVPTIIIYALRGVYVCINKYKEYIKSSIWMDLLWRLSLTLWIRVC